jgi:adenylate cyclase
MLFADLVGFSTLAEHMDPEELRTLMTETFAELTAEVEGRGGTVEKFIGDAVMAVFGAPRTHEDDPVRAVEASMAMLDVVRRRSERTPSQLQLRIGVNSGLVVSGTVGDGTQTGVMGDAVNIAARLQQAAEPGEVLVAESVWRRVREGYDTVPIGSLEVKGREQPVEAYRIGATREAAERRQAPFVGRRDELALLELLWSSAVKGNTHVVSLVGEPGVGKSRLLSQLAPRDGAVDLRISCGSERAFGPFLDLVERILGAIPTEVDELKRRGEAVGIDEETALLLAAFLGLGDAPPVVRMADEQQKRQVFAGVWQFLLSAGQARPTLVVLDDVHWADASSLDLLGFLLERLGGAPMLLLLSYRPGFDQVERTALRASHTGIRLEPLTPDESVALARGFLGVDDLPTDLERLVASRAEGNPFFIEELLQALLELGSLAVVDGTAVLAKVEVDIPDTVQGTILARVDRLEANERTVLQHAAVLGRTFATELISEVAGRDGAAAALEELGRAQLLVPQGPELWGFKHALIQEVVYETLLLRQRKETHRRIAEVLESRAEEDPATLELLAEHYARAEVPEKAREYAVLAGDLAAQRMGLVEAAQRYETALGLWGEGDEPGRLELLMKFGQTAYVGGSATAARSALVEAEEGWRRLGDMHRAGAALTVLGRVYWVTGESDRAADVLDRAIELLGPEGPSPDLVQAYVWASTLKMLTGRVDQSATLASEGLEMAESLGLDAARSHLLNTLGASEGFLGDQNGIDKVRQSLEIALRSGEAEAIGRAYTNLGNWLWEFGELREAADLCRRGREAMRRLGAPGFEWFIAGNEAAIFMDLGEYAESESLTREMLSVHRAFLGVPAVVNALLGLVGCLVRRGRFGEARPLADELLTHARRLGGGEFLAPALLRQAEFEAAQGNDAAARQAVTEAVRIVFDTPSVGHWFHSLVPAAGLLPDLQVKELIERTREHSRYPAQEARLGEAEARLTRDLEGLGKAADQYAELEMPYEEARCRLEAGELDRARELIDRFGLQEGPLGARLRELSTPR